MASISAPNALDVRLTELEGFGLGRPANVLFSNYVMVLLAHGAIDAATAELMSYTFHATRYGGLDADDLGFTETIARLKGVTAQFAAMPAKERLELSERVQRDLRDLSGNTARSVMAKVPVVPERAWEVPRVAAADGPWDAGTSPSNGFSDDGPVLSVPVHSSRLGSKPRRPLRLNLLIPTAFGLFFAGYASRNLVDHSRDRGGNNVASPQATQKGSKVVERQTPKEVIHTWAELAQYSQDYREFGRSLSLEPILLRQLEKFVAALKPPSASATSAGAASSNPQVALPPRT